MENKKYHVIVDPAAFSEILECVNFLKNVSFGAAELLFSEIINSINSLEEIPFRFPAVPEFTVLDQDEHKMIIGHGRYYVLYCIESDVVHIEYFGDVRKK